LPQGVDPSSAYGTVPALAVGMTRSHAKQLRLLYWIITPLFLLGQGWSAMQYLTEAPRMTDTITALGYPVYFMKILAMAKLLGVAAIVSSLSPTLKEWAYAGFTFDACGAFASHVSAGDSLVVALVPVAFFALQLASYLIWRQLALRSATRRRRHIYDLPQGEAELQT
jgi:DoxX-like family